MPRKRKTKNPESEGILDYIIIYFLRWIKMDRYYQEHPTFQRFAKYGILTTITFWLLKAPLIWLFDTMFNDIHINLVLYVFVIPSYVLSAFVVGIVVTLLGFVYSEWGIWKK